MTRACARATPRAWRRAGRCRPRGRRRGRPRGVRRRLCRRRQRRLRGLRRRVVAVAALRHHAGPRQRRGHLSHRFAPSGAVALALRRRPPRARRRRRGSRAGARRRRRRRRSRARCARHRARRPPPTRARDPRCGRPPRARRAPRSRRCVLDVQDVHAGAGSVGDPQLDRAPQPHRRGEARSAAQDRADVDRLAGARRAPGPAVAPARQGADDGQQVTGALGQLVVHARGHLAVALAREQPVGHHPVQPRAQLLGRDAREHALQLDETPRAAGQIAHDEQGPLVAHQVERPRVRSPLVVGVTLGGRCGGDGGGSWGAVDRR